MAADLATITGMTAPTGLLIGGQWSTGRAGSLPVINPATEDSIADVANATAEDALDAVGAASQALPGWAATPPRVRGECLRRAYELMIADTESLAKLMVMENGKALKDARAEITYAAEFFRWFAEEAVRIDGMMTRAPSGANRILVQHQPVGVSVLVTRGTSPRPWPPARSGPRWPQARGRAQASQREHRCPHSPSHHPDQAGARRRVRVLPTSTPGPVVGAMLADPRVRKLSFTGSTEVGRALLHNAADTVTNCSMELGGNAPFLIFGDADIDAAVDGAMIAKMRNGGEACTAANRFYVHDSVADEFARKFAARLSALIVGPGLEDGTDLGPLVNADTRTKVATLVDDAASDGSVGSAASADRRGYFYAPTVLDDVPPTAGILNEEIFGPVAPIVRFTDTDQAIAMANNTEYGLVSYLYTADMRRGLQVAEALEAGMVGINRGVVSDPAAPFGGVKQSGLGREGGHEGLLEFTETKYIAVDW